MDRGASRALSTIRACVAAGRFLVLRHFTERMDARGLMWADVLAVLDAPARVRSAGRDRFGRNGLWPGPRPTVRRWNSSPRWILTSAAVLRCSSRSTRD